MRSKSRVIVALAFIAFASGAVDQYFYPGREFPPTAMASMVIMAILIFYWYRLDSHQMGYRRSPWLDIGVIGFAIVALPYYFVRSRGWRRGAIFTGLLLLMYSASVILSMMGSYATYFAFQS